MSTPRERSRSEGIGHGIDVYGAHQSARSSSDEGQRVVAIGRGQRRVGWEVKTWEWDVGFSLMTSQTCCFRVCHKINGIGKSIYQNLWFSFFFFSSFFFTAGMLDMLESCRRSKKKKKEEEEEEDTTRTLESGKSYLILHGISGLNASTSVNCGWWRKAYKTNINSEGRSGWTDQTPSDG